VKVYRIQRKPLTEKQINELPSVIRMKLKRTRNSRKILKVRCLYINYQPVLYYQRDMGCIRAVDMVGSADTFYAGRNRDTIHTSDQEVIDLINKERILVSIDDQLRALIRRCLSSLINSAIRKAMIVRLSYSSGNEICRKILQRLAEDAGCSDREIESLKYLEF